VVLGEMAFSYDNVYIIAAKGKVRYTYLQDKCAQFCVHIKTIVSPGWIISLHITLTSLLYLHGFML